MGQDRENAPVDRARAAIRDGAWQEAFALLRSLQGERGLSSPEMELLGQSAYGSGALEAAVECWETLHSRCSASGDIAGAARAATTVALYLMMDTGLMAAVRGWLARSERLLSEQDECDVHAWVAVVRTYERFMCGDMQQAGEWASRAIQVGVRQNAPAATAFGRVATARLAILDGEVESGLRSLDEIAATSLSGGLDPLSLGMVYCELICAMQGLAQYDKAEEWTQSMERWRRGNAFGGINGRCRVHRAEILRLRGSCVEAEHEALLACQELRPWMRREYGWPLTELGTIRLRKGDLAGAEEAFLAAHENGWDPQPGLAQLRLAQSDGAAASTLIAHALDQPSNVPSKERPPYGALRRAPLLDAQVEIAVEVDDVPAARKAAEELSEIAETFQSQALRASAALARARVALCDGDAPAAVRECEEAVGGWTEVGAPYEAATARLVLAASLLAVGREEQALMERGAARSTFERIGAVLKAEQAGEPPRKKAGGLPGDGPFRRYAPTTLPADDNVFCLVGDTRSIVYDGRSVHLRDLKGMRYIARLLGGPGREFHVLELAAAEAGTPLVVRSSGAEGLTASSSDDAGPVLDAQAKEAYRRRLREIEEDVDEATRLGDMGRVALAEADRDYLIHELSRAFGLGGRDRRLGADSERARASVARSVRYAMDRLEEHHPSLGGHLRHALHMGTYCGYFPDPRVPITWRI